MHETKGALISLAILGCSFGVAAAGTISEFPHPRLTVQLHPRADTPFELSHIDRAIPAGVQGVELDLRLRPGDRQVVCSHSRNHVPSAPTLAAAIDRILSHRGADGTVRGNGLQFFLVLDVKERSPELNRGIVETLRRHADRWSTAAGDGSPRGITVVATGESQGLERGVAPSTLDSLCILEGKDYRGRIRNASPSGGPFQWVSLRHPGERGRIRALHAGTDLGRPGVFHVRAYDCHRRLDACCSSGVDAVNADLEEVPGAVALAARLKP